MAIVGSVRARTTALAIAAPFIAAVSISGQEAFELIELSEGVYVAIVQPQPPMYVFSNALVIVGDRAVTVVDTHQSPSAARVLLDHIREISDLPVSHVLNTHWHGDHVYGNQSYQEAFPDVVFVGHSSMREDVRIKTASAAAKEIGDLPGSIDQREAWVASGRGPQGEELSAEQITGLRRSARLRREYLAELRNLRLVPPSLTFDRELALHQGDRTIQVLHFGPAHTRGDAVLYLPDDKILAVGDLLEDGFPWVDENSFPVGWAGVLRSLSELDVEIIVPAHGPVLRDTLLLDRQAAFFREVARGVRAAVEGGLSLEETQSDIAVDRIPRFFDAADSSAEARFADYVERVVARAYAELTEDPIG